MRVAVFIFFNFESAVFFFQFDGYVNIDVNIVRVIDVIFYIAIAEFAKAIDKFSLAVNHGQDSDSVFLPTLKSSAPKAGAAWTMPVPSSVVTKSATKTLNAFGLFVLFASKGSNCSYEIPSSSL